MAELSRESRLSCVVFCASLPLPLLLPRPPETQFLSPHPQDLPEQPYLQPPLSILVIKHRAFGRTVLVGSHIVSHMLRFILQGHEEPREEEGEEEGTGDLAVKGPQGKGLSPWGHQTEAPLVLG